MNLKQGKLAAGIAAAALLAVPSAALARGGGTGGGGTPAPVSDAACASIVSTNPFQTVNRKASVTMKYNVTNCSGAAQTYTVDVAGVQQCLTPYVLGSLALKPGETRSIEGLMLGVCPLEVPTTRLTDIATVRDLDGNALASAETTVVITLAF